MADSTFKHGSSTIENKIISLRGQRVILDRDLAAIYGVQTRDLNKAVSRNKNRFPEDFMFQLTAQEQGNLMFQTGTSSWGGVRKRSNVFTEFGALMAANILKSPRATEMSLFVIRAFVKMREKLLLSATMEKRLAEIEMNLISHDVALRDLYKKIKPLLLPPPEEPQKPKRQIGFTAREKRAAYRA